ncbi:hypothetical protein PVK06_049624 [Gossypium arboreum]|uniref:Uncharacterized protein n=1 Tax=Gossypium arboreum TaxID=29729 RepID=A0ABR0MJH6_GOSAR|nr:hypothetical protein PVK06_049624 [Gossypium arboreum]
MKGFQQKIEASIRELTTSIEKLNSQEKLPSQTKPNLRQNTNAVTLRSGKILEPVLGKNLGQEIAQETPGNDEQIRAKPPLPKIQPLFPGRLNQCRKIKEDKEILETFRNVEINLPLLDAIRQIPRYAKFLKELCTNKRKLAGNEKVSVCENVSAVLQRKMPVKCKDRGMFAIPCKIGHLVIQKAMCDLGASINAMPYSIYESLNADFLTKTGVIIQLADRSIVHPEGVLEDVLVKVNELIFPADFYVIKMEDDNTAGSSDLLLGRPFLSTASTKIDVRSSTLTMEFNGEIVKFNVYDAISHSSEILSINRVDLIDSLVDETFESTYEDESEYRYDDYEFVKTLLLPSETKLLPSVVQAPDLELKPLPAHLKYAFLRKGNTLPIIISNKLSKPEEESLIQVLKSHKEVIGWTIAVLKGISPLTCTHKIYLEENTKPRREAQRRLNPNMMEVVKKE